jgi:hypothetical protein
MSATLSMGIALICPLALATDSEFFITPRFSLRVLPDLGTRAAGTSISCNQYANVAWAKLFQKNQTTFIRKL